MEDSPECPHASYENLIETERSFWNRNASSWDTDLLNPGHYANFENGYQRFLNWASSILREVPHQKAGIDVGCGTGIAADVLAEKVDTLYLLDIAEGMLKRAVQRHQKHASLVPLCSCVTEVPLSNSVVDIAINRGDVISHLGPHYQGFLKEMQRILRVRGLLLFDFFHNMSTAHFPLEAPKKVFPTTNEMETLLASYGFVVLDFDGLPGVSRILRVAAEKRPT